MTEHLILDPAIRDWCLFPLMAVIILITILRTELTALLQSPKAVVIEEHQQKQRLQRAQRLRTNGRFINRESYASRRQYFISEEKGPTKDGKDTMKGVLRNAVAPDPTNMDPSKMMGDMVGQMGFMATHVIVMGFANTFMGGFIMLRVPFPLTTHFRIMLQRGVEVAALDPSYVSSMSWSYLVMTAIRGVLGLVMGSDMVADEQRQMQMQMGMGGGSSGPGGFDARGLFADECTTLSIAPHVWAGESVEQRLLGSRYPSSSELDYGYVDPSVMIQGATKKKHN